MKTKTELQELFGSSYQRLTWLDTLETSFLLKKFIQPFQVNNREVNHFYQLGNVELADGKKLIVCEIETIPKTQLHRNRVQMREIVARQCIKQNADGALATYYDGEGMWRFSFIGFTYKLDESGQPTTETNESKRYTYLLGKGAKTHTAVERFSKLGRQSKMQDFTDAFAVEQLSTEFYKKLFKWYEHAKEVVKFPNDEGEEEKRHNSIGLIRMLTRLLFIWFIKEKGLVNENLFNREEVEQRIYWDKDSSYYKAILQNLFFATLNREIKDRGFRTTTNGKANDNNYLVTNMYRYQDYFRNGGNKKEIIALFESTPFLNGGLFECLDRLATDEERQKLKLKERAVRVDGFSDRPDNELYVPNELFFGKDENHSGLIELFQQYQFTVEESTPFDQEVALDPELLGHVFENLLASYNPETQKPARKESGSYYTPRLIVDYMVSEALATVLVQECGEPLYDRLYSLLDYGAKFEDVEKLFGGKERKRVVDTISKIKVLDPAVGSGAFAMEVLQKLTLVLKRIDPDNKYLDKYIKSSGELDLFDQPTEDYNRKLYLIENTIYGVDIQPIATQITKLRFFISLVVEQKTNRDKENYGVLPLPNLETRFVAADTLLGLDQPKVSEPRQGKFRNPLITRKEKELEQVRKSHLSAKTLRTKQKYRKSDEKLRREISELLVDDGWNDENAKKLTEWNPYDQNTFANWFDPGWMFGVSSFSLVIANPPYIQLQNDQGKLADRYSMAGFETFARSGDIYQLFYEKGYDLLTKNGVLCYITSNTWIKTAFGRKLRNFLTNPECNPKKLLDFGGHKIFASATVNTNILLLEKKPNQKQLKAVAFRSDYKKGESISNYFENNCNEIEAGSWFIATKAEIMLKKKIERIGKPLKECGFSINYGIKTGYNDAFIINNETKEALIREDSKSAEIIKPLLKGRNIQKYQANWDGLWLITTFPSLKLNIDHYPAIKKHLLSFGKERLEQAAKTLPDGTKSRKKTPHAWYELQDTCAYHAEFEKKKVVWKALGTSPAFHYIEDFIYINDKANLLTSNTIPLKFTCAVLNSDVFDWQFRNIGISMGKGFEYKIQYINLISFPPISSNETLVRKIEILVDKILIDKELNADVNTCAEESEINQLVYKLYELSWKEIQIIESRK